jgi:hypothetical protein
MEEAEESGEEEGEEEEEGESEGEEGEEKGQEHTSRRLDIARIASGRNRARETKGGKVDSKFCTECGVVSFYMQIFYLTHKLFTAPYLHSLFHVFCSIVGSAADSILLGC